ncbi:hypothetical protein GCM10027298_23430 [Epidermidibacterium keratini]
MSETGLCEGPNEAVGNQSVGLAGPISDRLAYELTLGAAIHRTLLVDDDSVKKSTPSSGLEVKSAAGRLRAYQGHARPQLAVELSDQPLAGGMPI